MERRTLEINVISAKDLKDVNLISKMDVYVTVFLSGDTQNNQKAKTNVDREGGTSPSWNFSMKFTIDEFAAKQNQLTLLFKLRCDRSLGDKDIGEVYVPVKELLNSVGDGKSMQFVSYQVRKPSGKTQGELHFSYKFSEKVAYGAPKAKAHHEPVTAYPVGPSAPPYDGMYPHPPPPPPPQGGYSYATPSPYGGYPPPPPGYGYPPPPPGYGYPAPPPGYGYPPVQQQQQQNKNKFGMGLGAGLLGGVLGGLLIGDLMSDGGDYGCDGGFDGGF